jgi:hypothetical protein
MELILNSCWILLIALIIMMFVVAINKKNRANVSRNIRKCFLCFLIFSCFFILLYFFDIRLKQFIVSELIVALTFFQIPLVVFTSLLKLNNKIIKVIGTAVLLAIWGCITICTLFFIGLGFTEKDNSIPITNKLSIDIYRDNLTGRCESIYFKESKFALFEKLIDVNEETNQYRDSKSIHQVYNAWLLSNKNDTLTIAFGWSADRTKFISRKYFNGEIIVDKK